MKPQLPQYSVQEARDHLGDLVISAQRGESVIITRYGKPAALLVPISGPVPRLRPPEPEAGDQQ